MSRFREHEIRSQESAFDVVLKPEDRPEFERVYTAPVGLRNITIKLTRRTTIFGERTWGTCELTQSNGRWVLFDADSVADKIIEVELVTAVEALCHEARGLDDEFMARRPSSFIDEGGVTWNSR